MGANDGEEKGKGNGDDQATPPKTSEDTSALLDSLASFEGFVVEEVLSVNDTNKVATVVGR